MPPLVRGEVDRLPVLVADVAPGEPASERIRVQEMLSYLAASLPAASARARLLALQCSLRAGRSGRVRLPAGLLRGMRLAHDYTLWQDLEDARWLRLPLIDASGYRSVSPQIMDDFSVAAPRHERTRAAGWALRITGDRRLRRLSPAARVTALALSAHTPVGVEGSWDAAQLLRVCGLPAQSRLRPVLAGLTDAGVLSSWTTDNDRDIHWRLPGHVLEQSAEISVIPPGS
ncbi:hypothetical protein [Streptomyces sp. 35G-GA-8]|uniref:hypothetical protein n=1 Tax=Streptomyces sp. 35G-GA-8 TaxID=2939434 RepID=UPI00201EF2C2|nr:hypothetical protein [Streptomyces sp. 35G-GA-8]MCL7382295.1 hypothetical protein [Streptomyces sp. 35G-GA-8]